MDLVGEAEEVCHGGTDKPGCADSGGPHLHSTKDYFADARSGIELGNPARFARSERLRNLRGEI